MRQIVEPCAVNMPRLRSHRRLARRQSPVAAAIAAALVIQSGRELGARRPRRCRRTAARIRQVMPATVAMNTHFSHISCRMAVAETWRRNPRPKASPRSRARAPTLLRRARRTTEQMRVVEMEDPALGVERRRDQALAAEHGAGAETRAEHIHVAHAVEQRQDRGIRPDGRRERRRSRRRGRRPCSSAA